MTPLNLSTLTADEKALLDVMVERGEALFEPNIGPEGVTYREMEGYSQEVGGDKVLRLLASLTEKGVPGLRGRGARHLLPELRIPPRVLQVHLPEVQLLPREPRHPDAAPALWLPR